MRFCFFFVFFCNQKTAYDMRISDWSLDVCSSDLIGALEMTRVNISPLNSLCAKTLVPTMPFLFESIAHMRKSLDGPAGEEILKSCEPEGLVDRKSVV